MGPAPKGRRLSLLDFGQGACTTPGAQKKETSIARGFLMVGVNGFEPLTPTMST